MINVVINDGQLMTLSEKILKFSTYVNDLYSTREFAEEPIPLIDATEEDVDILNIWMDFQQAPDYELTNKDFIFTDYDFKRLDVLEVLNTQELLKIMQLGFSNQILLLVESCAKLISKQNLKFVKRRITFRDNSGSIVSKKSDFIKITKRDYRHRKISSAAFPINKNFIMIILKYKSTKHIVKQSDSILKMFKYNPTFDRKFDYLFNVETNYVEKFSDMYPSSKPFVLKFGTTDQLSDSRVKDIIHKILSENDIPKDAQEFEVPQNIKAIGDYSFENCRLLQRVVLSDKISVFGDSCFKSCVSLSFINMPTKLSIIGHSSFKNCSSLAELELPHSTKFILNEAFANCTSLTKLVIPETVEFIGQRALRNTNLGIETINAISEKFSGNVF